jgi:hypothetical protein
MHQTTIRFAPDLWAALETEASRAGVSVAHYVRDAAVSRLAFAAGAEQARRGSIASSPAPPRKPRRLAERIEAELNSAEAVRAQGRLARARSKRLRTEADVLRVDSYVQRAMAEEQQGSSARGRAATDAVEGGAEASRERR